MKIVWENILRDKKTPAAVRNILQAKSTALQAKDSSQFGNTIVDAAAGPQVIIISSHCSQQWEFPKFFMHNWGLQKNEWLDVITQPNISTCICSANCFD